MFQIYSLSRGFVEKCHQFLTGLLHPPANVSTVLVSQIQNFPARRKPGDWGHFSPSHYLLKFANFESEKGCKNQGRKNEDSNLYMFEEATRIYHILQKWDVFQRSKGCGHGKFSLGQAPGPPFCSLRSLLVSAPPFNMNFVPTGLLSAFQFL